MSQSVVSVRRSISFQSNLNRLTFLTAIFARVRVTTKAGRGKKVKVINGSMSRVLVRDNKDGNAVGLYGAIVDREQFVFCCSAYTEDCQHMRAICSLSEFTAAISVSRMPEEPASQVLGARAAALQSQARRAWSRCRASLSFVDSPPPRLSRSRLLASRAVHANMHDENYAATHHARLADQPTNFPAHNYTRSSSIAEGPRDASCQLKSCQLPRNSAETTCTTSPDPSISCR